MFGVHDLFDLKEFPYPSLFEGVDYAWLAISRIAPFLENQIWESIPEIAGAYIGPKVLIAPGAKIEPGATIQGPAIICENATVRTNAYIRNNVIVGPGSVVGNASELKNCILIGQYCSCQFPSPREWCGYFGFEGLALRQSKCRAVLNKACHSIRRVGRKVRQVGNNFRRPDNPANS